MRNNKVYHCLLHRFYRLLRTFYRLIYEHIYECMSIFQEINEIRSPINSILYIHLVSREYSAFQDICYFFDNRRQHFYNIFFFINNLLYFRQFSLLSRNYIPSYNYFHLKIIFYNSIMLDSSPL
jgi:hypothetical protein